MTLILIILLCNTSLFIALLINTATIAKSNEKQLNIIKADNQTWKDEVRSELNFLKHNSVYIERWLKSSILQKKEHTDLLKIICNYSETSNLWIIALQDLLHKNK